MSISSDAFTQWVISDSTMMSTGKNRVRIDHRETRIRTKDFCRRAYIGVGICDYLIYTTIVSHISLALRPAEVKLPFPVPVVAASVALTLAAVVPSGPTSPGAMLPGVKSLIPAPPSGVGTTRKSQQKGTRTD